MKTTHLQNAIGKHWLIEMYACNIQKLEVVDSVQEILSNAARISGATIVNENFHQFSPYGVSGVVVIEESHFTIHTWPEHGFAAVDFFTCGDSIDIQKAIVYLGKHFETETMDVNYFDRGSIKKAQASLQDIMPDKL